VLFEGDGFVGLGYCRDQAFILRNYVKEVFVIFVNRAGIQGGGVG
jgi:hypothetical protein